MGSSALSPTQAAAPAVGESSRRSRSPDGREAANHGQVVVVAWMHVNASQHPLLGVDRIPLDWMDAGLPLLAEELDEGPALVPMGHERRKPHVVRKRADRRRRRPGPSQRSRLSGHGQIDRRSEPFDDDEGVCGRALRRGPSPADARRKPGARPAAASRPRSRGARPRILLDLSCAGDHHMLGVSPVELRDALLADKAQLTAMGRCKRRDLDDHPRRVAQDGGQTRDPPSTSSGTATRGSGTSPSTSSAIARSCGRGSNGVDVAVAVTEAHPAGVDPDGGPSSPD